MSDEHGAIFKATVHGLAVLGWLLSVSIALAPIVLVVWAIRSCGD